MLFKVVPANRQVILYRSGGNLHHGCDFLYREVFEIMQDDGRSLLFGNPGQGPLELFMLERGVGGRPVIYSQCLRGVNGGGRGGDTAQVVDEAVVCDPEQPGFEIPDEPS